jgi:hypothetical protein
MARHREAPAARQRGEGEKIEQPSQLARRKPKTTRPRSQDHCGKSRRLALYDGRQLLGHVVGDERRWEARSPNNKLIGIYASWIGAANAVTTAELAS